MGDLFERKNESEKMNNYGLTFRGLDSRRRATNRILILRAYGIAPPSFYRAIPCESRALDQVCAPITKTWISYVEVTYALVLLFDIVSHVNVPVSHRDCIIAILCCAGGSVLRSEIPGRHCSDFREDMRCIISHGLDPHNGVGATLVYFDVDGIPLI